MKHRCVDIFPPAEQVILMKYRKDNFAEKTLNYTERRLIGKCPLTPEEVRSPPQLTTHPYKISSCLPWQAKSQQFKAPYICKFSSSSCNVHSLCCIGQTPFLCYMTCRLLASQWQFDRVNDCNICISVYLSESTHAYDLLTSNSDDEIYSMLIVMV